MNITETFRRKNKFHKPIIVFKQLYRDYYKQSLPSNIQTTVSTNRNSNTQNFNGLSTSSFNSNNKIYSINSTLQTSIKKGTLDNQYDSIQNNEFNTINRTLTKSKSNNNLCKYNRKNYEYQIEQQKVKKTNSVEQFTKYLQRIKQNEQSNQKNCTLTSRNSIQLQKQQYKRSKSTKYYTNHSQPHNTFVFKLLQRAQLQELQKQKRGYFRNQYTQHHPFLQKNLNNFKIRSFNQKQKEIPKILPDIFKQNLVEKLKTPLQRRIQLQQLKTKIDEKKIVTVQKFSKIRYNYLVKKHLQNQLGDKNNDKQNFNCHKNRNSNLQQTKQNIFPGSANVQNILG